MNLVMIGSGYVGLVSGVCFANFGHSVTCVDQDAAKIASLRRGSLPIYEPGLNALVEANTAAGRLVFSTDLQPAVAAADIVFIAVGTPSRRGDGHADLTYVHEAARQVAHALDRETVITIKSTVPVGTAGDVEKIIRETRPEAVFSVASNPEFLREGAAIEDFMRPDRIIVGVEDEAARAAMEEVYRPLNLNQAPLMMTGRRTAELIKYAANAFLAMKVTFINEMADLCEQVDVNVQEVARGIGLDRRIGPKFLHAGPGYGGSCFPKDTAALARIAKDAGAPARLVETTIEINTQRKQGMAERVVRAMGGTALDKTIAVLGLTFKPNTDDMREAPAIDIIQALQAGGASVRAYDPRGMDSARQILEGVIYCSDSYEAAAGADCVVVATEWNEFRALDLERLGSVMASRIMVDLRNVYRGGDVRDRGFAYTSIGRP